MTDPRPSHPSSPRRAWLPAWGAFCFFISGAAGLLYEVVWSKQLAYLLGSSLHAVATVVAAFLAAAEDALRRGLAALPGDADLTRALASLGAAR